MKITFTVDVALADGTPGLAGQTYELNEASARRWLRRGKAVEAGKAPVETAAVDKAEKSTPKRAVARAKPK